MRRTALATVALALVLSGVACGSSPPAATPAPSTTTTTTTEPATTGTDTDAVFAGVWPFASPADLDAYDPSSDPTFLDPRTTAHEFAARYVGMDDPVVFDFEPSGPGAGRVGVGARFGEGHVPVADPGVTFTVEVAQLGQKGPEKPWTVVGAASPDLRIDGPVALDTISSPVHLSGRVNAFESTAAVEVREDGMVSGQSIGTGYMTATEGSVTFAAPNRPTGAVLALDRSSADGVGIVSATVVRVQFAAFGQPPVTPALACNDRRTGGGGGFGTLADVRVAAHEGFDRITFEFSGVLPAYQITPARLPLSIDPSGQPLALDGQELIDVVFHDASARYSFEASGGQIGAPPYRGPDLVTPGFEVLREAAQRGDFEAVLTWTLGASTATCLRVLELQAPPRLAIDLAHPA